MGLVALTITPLAGADAKPFKLLNQIYAAGKKLNIVCLGAHPGDPEFGCGGTMAKYSETGHSVTFLYLTRGEASDQHKTYAEMAALRTQEAETACKIVNATPQFAGQIDGNSILDKEWNDKATKMLSALTPDVVFTQWPVDAHPITRFQVYWA